MSTINTCKKCGCQDDFLTTPPPCPTPAACPEPEPCSEISYAQCNIYTGPDILCGTDVVVPTNTDMATALNDVITYFCDNQTRHLRFVKEFTSNLDAAFLTITRAELNACGIDPSLCSEDGSEFSDFVVNIWYKDNATTIWRLLQPYSLGGSWGALVDDITGDITFLLNQAPMDPPVRVRIVLIF